MGRRGGFVCALLLSCGDDENGGTGPEPPGPNPDDPHPVWVYMIHRWAKYDQNGHEILSVGPAVLGKFLGVNPANGDVWATGDGGFNIYDSSATFKKNTKLEGYVESVAFDTKDRKVWVLHKPEVDNFWLAKLSYEGNIIFDKRFGREDPSILDMDVYEEAGNLWVTSRGGSRYGGYVYKLDTDGEILFFKTGRELGYEYSFSHVYVDQTDGGVWIGGTSGSESVSCILKIDRDARPVQKLSSPSISLFDVGRTTGDVLITTYLGVSSYTRLYDKSGNVLWQSDGVKRYGPRGICDYDGSCWIVYYAGRDDFRMSKISRTGEYLIRDIPTFGNLDFLGLRIKNDPYPY